VYRLLVHLNSVINFTNYFCWIYFNIIVPCACKGEVVPLRSIEAHLGHRRYSSYSFLTSAPEGGEWSASRPGRPLPPGKEPPVPIVQEAGWAPEPVWTQRLEERSSASVGDRTPAVQSVVRHCTDWATMAPVCVCVCVRVRVRVRLRVCACARVCVMPLKAYRLMRSLLKIFWNNE
jgi:hypothetical protein